jgi:hypothetical protein
MLKSGASLLIPVAKTFSEPAPQGDGHSLILSYFLIAIGAISDSAADITPVRVQKVSLLSIGICRAPAGACTSILPQVILFATGIVEICMDIHVIVLIKRQTVIAAARYGHQCNRRAYYKNSSKHDLLVPSPGP